ncbi:mechanosensitive channel MscK [Pseudomonas sp. N040]|uniref:mechanosensitive channel MscK n=1 Tax=Pseudomonas sp. N040 TaxID=2785325 RepID=UPI0018A323F6|nr:mechanosensitive channel MscK [Pseudomonas sp. N040]MBF7729870.1 mechanosensitive channel MscK [Pseudomonas sp. N040]MBW7013512.1 mechanosensitive channel MscK [Pseudomonas sp. N040]
MRYVLLVALLGLSLNTLAQPENPLPSIEEIQQSLDGLADRKLPEAEHKALQAILQGTLQNLEEIAATRQELLDLQHQVKTAPQVIKQSQAELIRLGAQPETAEVQRYAKYNLLQLEGLLADRSEELGKTQKALSDANSIYINAQSRPERAQSDVSRILLRSQKINAALTTGKDNGKPLSKEVRVQLESEKRLLEDQASLLKEQMAANDILLDLGTALRDLQLLRASQLDREMLELQGLISEKRRALSERDIEKFAIEAENASPDSLLARENQANLKLSQAMLEATDQLNLLNRRNLEVSQQLDNVKQAKKSLDENISVLRGSLLLAKILYHQKKSLEDIRIDRGLADQIADIRLRQFEISQQREQLANPQQYLQQLLSKSPGESASPQMLADLEQQVKTRYDLLERYGRELNALLNASMTLQLSQTYLLSSSTELRDTLEEQMFWVPSNKHLTFKGTLQLPENMLRQLRNFPLGKGISEFSNALTAKPWIFIPVLLLVLLLVWQRNALKHKLSSLNKDIGHFKRDSQLHTPLALLLNLLLALPVTLLLLLAGFALQLDAQGQNLYLADAMYEMAQAWLVLYTAYCLLRPDGVAERHFHWPRDVTFSLFSQMRALGMLIMPLLAIATVAEHQPEYLSQDSFGMLLVMVGFILLTLLLGRLLLTGPAREHASSLRLALGGALTLLPLALVIAIGLGYYYTALKLTDRLIDTLYVVLIWIVLEAVMVRGLAVAARRLAYQRAATKREQMAKEGSEGGEFIEEPKLDIEQVNEQSLRLMRLALTGLLVVSLYWVWADLLSVFSYLDNFTLYEYSSGSGATASMVPLSLGDLIGALLIVAITIALASNLPGLLEVLVLSRLQLAQGSAYAVTTLLSYAIVGIGSVTTLSVLGVSWDKLQWLVAALSLGIGFGMQEIFANFISGLIILFERPVRIGDTVTIGPLSGTVSRIQIRATTITDFDRKEIIVPNKSFITDQLINWSLTDTVTRIVLTIGLAYETDLALARKLIMQALHGNSRVLRDPEPQAFFVNIGASTFNFDVRFHVRELVDRLPATDEVLTAIAMSFREHHIDMAFNQMDVYVKNLQGREAALERVQLNPPSSGRADVEAAADGE